MIDSKTQGKTPGPGLDIEDMAAFQKTTKGNRPKKPLDCEPQAQGAPRFCFRKT